MAEGKVISKEEYALAQACYKAASEFAGYYFDLNKEFEPWFKKEFRIELDHYDFMGLLNNWSYEYKEELRNYKHIKPL